MTFPQSILRVALATGLLLLIPLLAQQFVPGMHWSPGDFAAAGLLLFGAGLVAAFVWRQGNSLTYRLGAALAAGAGLLLVWANLAVGLVGSEDNPANGLYLAVLAVAVVGALAARFRPRGMAHAMFAAALTYALVTVVALFVWPPTGAAAEPQVHLLNVLVANGLFAGLWVAAGWLFRRAAAAGSALGQSLL
ncbi:hypothetical protein [Hymenobacter persicinus]|uniref:Uncharacterized protein n=1 Tax=Hymenobacter persicinus TaxID=2025506 RepID=A0A4V1ZAQ7_9BACT|nr:hypothetical protein [Hymenobacter persicinus]RYU79318.1 hypothetical protein EWM57_11280 [Hymenobacter persicinus]